MPEILGKMEKKDGKRLVKTTVDLHIRKDDGWSSMQRRSKERPINTSVRKS